MRRQNSAIQVVWVAKSNAAKVALFAELLTKVTRRLLNERVPLAVAWRWSELGTVGHLSSLGQSACVNGTLPFTKNALC